MLKDTGMPIAQRLINELPVLDIENCHARAVVSLYGGQVLSFQPNGEEKVLWLSPKAVYREKAAIRGGIPVCWPWFGKREEGGPNHGFARTGLWTLEQQETLTGGETRLLLSLNESSHSDWFYKERPCSARLKIEIIIGAQLEISLITENLGNQVVEISQALHSYFTVSDVESICVSGLEGVRFLSKAEDGRAYVQEGDVTFSGEVDRVYLDNTETCIINDQGLKRKIVIRKSGSNATVVWNPGRSLSREMADMEADSYRSTVCVETATAAELPVELEPSGKHRLTARISVERY